MKIFVLEYNESYTGGGVVCIAKDKENLNNLLRNYFDNREDSDGTVIQNIVLDEELCEQLKYFNKYRDNVFETDIKFFDTLNEYCPLSIKDLRTKINLDKVSYSNGEVRVDWVEDQVNLPEGLYLIGEFETNSENIGIISDTYYCA